jgi:hypothetical protein
VEGEAEWESMRRRRREVVGAECETYRHRPALKNVTPTFGERWWEMILIYSGTHRHSLPPHSPPYSLTKLIAKDRAMSTLNVLANHLINKKQREYAWLI